VIVSEAAPTLTVMNDTLICGPANALLLIASSNGEADLYHWSTNAAFTDQLNPDPADSTALLAPVVPGTYHVRASLGTGCAAEDSVVVSVSLIGLALLGDTLICALDTASISLNGVDPGSTINWTPAEDVLSGQGTSTITVAPQETSAYGVTVAAPSGCQWSSTFIVSVSPIGGGSIGATADPLIGTPGVLVQLQAAPDQGVTYQWTPASLVSDPTIAAPTATIQQTTVFTVTVSDGICTRSASVEVKVVELVCDEPDIFVPNTFTPNGDGRNDVLFVRGRNIERMEFKVFDRWGEKVFESVDPASGWDGTYNGRAVDPAVFVYHLRVWCVDGQQYFTKGNVTVAR
jgi:gliding motility-associated-like protein